MFETPDHPEAPPPVDPPPCFIVGMSRAGTTWLGKCLNEHPDVAVFGETSFFGRWFVSSGEDGFYTPDQIQTIIERLKRRGTCVQAFSGDGAGCLKTLDRERVGPLLDQVMKGIDTPQTPGELFLAIGRAVAASEGAKRFVEKTPHHVNWLGRITRALPEARFIMLMREPYGFMRSYHHQGDRKPRAERFKYLWKEHPLGTALVWRGYVRSIVEARRRFPQCTLLLRFEDLTDRADEVLGETQEFFGITPVEALAERVPPDNTSFPDRSPSPLRGEEIFWMNLIAGRAIREAGYERRGGSFAPVGVIVSILLIPFWVVRQFIHFRGRTGGSLIGYVWNWLRPRGGGSGGARG